MRRALCTLFAVGLFVVGIGGLRAQGDARAILQKAIKAQGGEKNVAKLRIMRIKVKGKGTFIPGQGEVDFTIEDTWQMPDQYKSTSHLTINGQPYTQTQVVNGDKGWISANGQVQSLPAAAIDEMKEQKYAEDCDRLLELNDPKYQLTALPEVKIDGRSAVGVKVASKGHRDVKLYFDKSTGLPVKREQTVLGQTGKMISQEVFFKDYRDKEGVKHWMKISALRDGKKYVDAEVVEIEFFDKLPDKVFAKP